MVERYMVEERQLSGAVLRADVAWLEKQGLKAAVRARLPPDTQALLDKPPLLISWVAARHIDALLDAVLQIGGEEKLVQLGEETTRASFGPVLRPLLRTLVSLFGASPAALFGRIDSTLPVFVKGASFTYEPGGDRDGFLHLRTVDRPPAAWLLQWKGTLRFTFEVANAQGSINSCVPDPDGRGAVYAVSWSA
jgi:hypothetical protein